jgi:hypothetical protein
MEKVEFLASTGVSFYSPENDVRFTDLLLQKTWNYRVLKTPRGAVSLQLGNEPIANAVSSAGEALTDCGKISVRFEDALEACLRKWIPLPYTRKTAEKSTPSQSNDWIRLFISRPPLCVDENIFRVVFTVDSSVSPSSGAAGAGQEHFGFCADDVGLPFEANVGSAAFWRSSTLITWVQSLFKSVRAAGSEEAPAYTVALAGFMTLIEGLRQAEVFPEVSFMHPEGKSVDVHLVLDLGNSRACGILAEHLPGESVNLDECVKLEIRDLGEPGNMYTEPFDTSFKFRPPLFSDPENPVPHGGSNFPWPSLLRLGTEAARLDPCDIGDTGMSSPKRYLWDDRFRHFPWYFHLPATGVGRKINASFLKYLDANGEFKGDSAQPPFEPCYPPSSLMTFLVLEILNHAFAQVNSYSYRKFRGHRLARRVLRSIVITTPCGMSGPERAIYQARAQSAVDLFFRVVGGAGDEKPALFLGFDEATAVHLTYLYGEIKHRFLGDSREAIAALGRERTTNDGARGPVFRLAGIDIGGGTSDLMIAEYSASPHDSTGIRQRMLFSEGFSIAGDEIAKRLIEKLILKRVFTYAQEKNPGVSWEEFQSFFGPGRGGRDKRFIDMKAELCRQIWIPMAHRHLEFAERDTDDPQLELSFDKFFSGRFPGSNVLDFFSEHMRNDFGCDLTLAEIPWELSRRKINAVITNVLENILRIFSEVISQFRCDAVILGGKPSSLPVIRDLLVRLMPVAPEKIIGLKGYPVGSWYPFSQRGGGIADPKTTCVVGAAVWLFSEQLKNLDGLALQTDSSLIKKRECFIGPYCAESQTISPLLFPAPDGKGNVLSVVKPVILGIRRVDSEVCLADPIWEVSIDQEQLKSPGPFVVHLKQDENRRECLAIARLEDEKGSPRDPRMANLSLRTMLSEQYWLDTGCFEL